MFGREKPESEQDALRTQVSLGVAPEGVSGDQSGTTSLSDGKPPSLQTGALIEGRFEILARAGSGGMADVYRARDLQRGIAVAVKVLKESIPSLERFEREARLLAEVRHPSIAAYVAHGHLASGIPYIAMEWLEGYDLETLLRQRRLSVRESVDLARRVAHALAAVHERGVIHRDVNPSNLFLVGGRTDDVRILDFGVARRLSAAQKPLTLAGSPVGTPGYMAPEQAQGQNEVSPAADVFALGCVLFECLTGRRAFSGGTLLEILAKILAEQLPDPSTYNDRVPPDLDRLVASLLSKHPSERPSDGGAVAHLLTRLGELDDASPESMPRSSTAAVTDTEQRISCVILVRVDSNDAFEAAVRAAGPHGVRPSRLADGTIVANLHGRGTATDQVAQAARCALALRDALNPPAMALATGLTLTTGEWPSGRAIEVATGSLMRVEQESLEAPSRRKVIWIDETTAALLDSRFDVRSGEGGFVLRGTRHTQEPTRTVLGRQTRCVGRKRELSLLEATFAECEEEGIANVVLMTGPPGIGKSRLAHEFTRRLRRQGSPVEILWGSGDPMSVGAPFSILIQAILRACNMAEAETDAARRHKLHERLRRVVPEAHLQRVTEFIGELVGTPFPDDASPQLRAARQDAVLRGDQTLRAFEDFLEAECKQHPVVMVLDDFHWGDLTTVKLVDSVLRNLAEQPLMIVVLARPEIHELFPKLWAQRGVSELRLSGLTRRSSAQLVNEILGAKVEDATVERVVERAQGNPFWLEELLRAEAAGHGDRVPDRILLLAQSRLEQLDGDARRVLRAASVFGQRFWLGAVRSLLAGEALARDLDHVVRGLVDEEILVERPISRFPGERELGFRSGLMRDAAYAALTDDDKQRGHCLAGNFLEAAGESEALPLATHFARGNLPDRAVVYYRRAAEQALGGNDLEAAIERAALGIGAGPSPELAALLRLIQAEANKWLGNNSAARKHAQAALELAAPGSGAWCTASAEAAVAAGKLGQRDDCIRLAVELLESPLGEDNDRELSVALSRVATQLVLIGATDLARELLDRVTRMSDELHPSPGVLAWLCEARAVLAGATDDPVGRIELAESAATRFEEAGDLRNACLQRVSLGFAQVEFGAYREAERSLREALGVAQRLALSNSIPLAQAHLARALSQCGRIEEALELEAAAIAAFDQQGNLRLAGIARVYLARMHEAQGDLERGAAEARRAVDILESAPPLRRSAFAALSLVLLAQGDRTAALSYAELATKDLPEGTLPVGESLVRLSLVEANLANGRAEEAKQALDIAMLRLNGMAEKIESPRRKRQFLDSCPERSRLLALHSELSLDQTRD